ncbi:MAG: DUF1015 family protein [Ignavibacteria bacterium]
MPVIRPFKALRPDKNVASLVASVPYDVVNREEAAFFAKGYPNSYLRITRSEIELDNSVDPYSGEVYKKAKANLERIKLDAPLLTDDCSHFYVYKLVMGLREQTGVAATFSTVDYDNNSILKHEKTRREKEDDRTNHIVTTGAQTGPVFLTYRGVAKVNELIRKTMLESQPLYDFIASDGVTHTIWIMPDEFNETIITEIANVSSLYIADGHHRAASAGRARKVKMENNPNHTGDEEYNFFLAVLFPAEELKILPYNRVVFDLNGLSRQDFLDHVREYFICEEANISEPPDKRTFGMYMAGKWYSLWPNARITVSDNICDNLDVSVLQNYLLRPILNIDDPRTNKRIDFIGGIRGTSELESLVNSGRAAVAFSLYPVSVGELMDIADAGEIMPPKSTWFEPKLRDGLLVHLI